jgi:Phosphodiester glycosidase
MFRMRMGPLRRLLGGVLATIAVLAAAPAASAASGPIQSGLGSPTSVRTLRPGVSLTVYTVKLLDAGVLRTERLYKVAWTIGNPHVQLRSALMGPTYSDDSSIRLNSISNWWAATGSDTSMTAAINGDFFADSWQHNGAGVPSGLLVRGRTISNFGWGGPAVGYRPAGDLVMGRPTVYPTAISLPGGKTATIGAFNSLSANGVTIHSDQVAAYVNSGATVLVPSGYVGYVVPSTVLRGTLRGTRGGYSFANGASVKETVAAFRFAVPGMTHGTTSMPTSQPVACPTGTCVAGVSLTVPSNGVVLLAKAGGLAATGLSARAATSSPLNVATDPAAWADVHDVMGGKPQLVAGGSPIMQRPSYVDSWQWDNSHWRPAVVRASNGQGWLLVVGGSNGVGVKGLTWAKMLVQLGARDAMGFDNNSSTELFRRGASPITAYGYERDIPSATYLAYN